MLDSDCWRAVLARDPEANGRFVYAVRSTGIYCRPICASRRPGRAQVNFFEDPARAEAAGFRPCRRCRPEDADMADSQTEMVRKACAAIDAATDGPPTLAALGENLGVSPHHLQRVFKKLMGISPRQYADERRLGRLKMRLKRGEAVTGALYEAGYGSSSRLYENAGEHLGMTPGTYRRGGEGARMRFTIVDCTLGRLVVAATDRGLSFLGFGDDDGDLEEELREEFPKAEEIRRDDAGLAEWVGPLIDHLAGQVGSLPLPLDVQATAFQRRVWEALRDIPAGETRTYREIAAQLGQPTASRAVGSACARNPVSLVIPCHRVVREDGGLGGYRWGLERKERLIATERGAAAKPRAKRRG
ncbi:MAG: bifunctional DNA-binding transcriptional regulator/O6-methylguanine-DNA methyltransferase Ada [Proteobacteria bacterium]|nr:bifunctional DNA-binding transcriptional regulator/O6-methylguanine-DNA methyltransferase Ada [Pseudomonadota bacterium]